MRYSLRGMLQRTAPASPVSAEDRDGGVRLFPITQATAATFSGLFIDQSFLCFIQAGTKRVVCPVNGEMTGAEGDLIVFPGGSVVTLENRPLRDAHYRAEGVYVAHDLVHAVFPDHRAGPEATGIQILRADPHRPAEILDLIRATISSETLPPPIRQHRLLEPLIWLRHHGVRLTAPDDNAPLTRLRRLIETDLTRPWRSSEVARHFAMSEPTFRRWLARSGLGFARVLHTTRLEKGLALLQTTGMPVSQIALDCGFKTPSHFSDSFKKRFGIKPRDIRLREE